jgi:hypothetical protein
MNPLIWLTLDVGTWSITVFAKESPVTRSPPKLCEALAAAFVPRSNSSPKKGFSLKDFLAARHDPHALHGLVKKTKGHDYALLFEETALAENRAMDDALLESYLWGVWDKMSDQVAKSVVPCENWQNFPDLRSHLDEVREEIAAEVHRIAAKLAEDPTWLPRRPATKGGTKANETQTLLGESMLGVLPK